MMLECPLWVESGRTPADHRSEPIANNMAPYRAAGSLQAPATVAVLACASTQPHLASVGLSGCFLMDKVQRRVACSTFRAAAPLPNIAQPIVPTLSSEQVPEGVWIKDALVPASATGELDGVVLCRRVEQVADWVRLVAIG